VPLKPARWCDNVIERERRMRAQEHYSGDSKQGKLRWEGREG